MASVVTAHRIDGALPTGLSSEAHVGDGDHNSKEVRCALLGNVDSGKSTLVGVLSKGVYDDGRGLARSMVLNYSHEREKGQTSSVALEMMGFRDGTDLSKASAAETSSQEFKQVLPSKVTGRHDKDFYDVATRSTHQLMLVDLCGHEKYLKTTIFGLTCIKPDFAVVIVGANHGPLKMTKEHLGLCVALGIPVIVVITKIDMCPPQVLKTTEKKVARILKMGKRKQYCVRTMKDAETAVSTLPSNRIAPVFKVSSVTGEGLDLLKQFLTQITCEGAEDLLALRKSPVSLLGIPAAASTASSEGEDDENESTTNCSKSKSATSPSRKKSTGDLVEFRIDGVYVVKGVGVVVGGVSVNGRISVGQRLNLGPDKVGNYTAVTVKSIHCKCVERDSAAPRSQCTLALKSAAGSGAKPLKRAFFRKGMVLLSDDYFSKDATPSYRTFTAAVHVLHHSTTMTPGYSPVVHIGVVRQAVKVLAIKDLESGEDIVLRTGSRALITFEFCYYKEYLSPGMILIFREGRAKGIGRVVTVGDRTEEEAQ